MNIAAPSHVMPVSSQIIQAGQLVAKPKADRLFVATYFGTDPQEEFVKFCEGHVHGAVYAQIRDVFAGPETPTSGSLPLPEIATLQAQINAWKVGKKTEVIVYGPSLALAARGWWVLKWAGLQNVRVMDGGMRAWEMAGGAVAQGESPPLSGYKSDPLVLTPGSLQAASIEEVENLPDETVLIDARDETAYMAGCIPGAVNLAASDLWTPMGLLRSSKEISDLFSEVGVRPGSDVVAYCGGGVLSALVFMTLETMGIQPRLFVGSWSQWSRYKDRMASSAPYLRNLVENSSEQSIGRYKA